MVQGTAKAKVCGEIHPQYRNVLFQKMKRFPTNPEEFLPNLQSLLDGCSAAYASQSYVAAYEYMIRAEMYQRYCACRLLPLGEMELTKIALKLEQYHWVPTHSDHALRFRGRMTPSQKAMVWLYRALAYHGCEIQSPSRDPYDAWDEVSRCLSNLFKAVEANPDLTGPFMQNVEHLLSGQLGELVQVHGKLYWSEVRDKVKEICEEHEARRLADAVSDLTLA
ncbi:MAG: hypothetical protein Q9187_001638 [Circinaria calcarea]